ncbi:hypothetical protein BDP27DRAFT_1403600 [Rhodocollybia butyracea]|uniref:Uncharacterized protein n=1 Tax=Rhodocollybia butyracea TaxID=206335 RepID=A0A9P5PSS2_9AGAR|nr:hypothetical protein BDP27DRAFT_1403600 [Rhodocollybia butyracea]
MVCRERRSWTEEEDRLLREAVKLVQPGSLSPSKWHAIAEHVPSRTNKDCRKRWFAKMASDVVKGGWAPEEDEELVKAIEKYGTRWSLVSAYVQTRNSDQCSKRWTDTLNPAIDRTRWSAEADALLLDAVEKHGKVWAKIVRTHFPGRTGLAAKNRFNSITRYHAKTRWQQSRSQYEYPSFLSMPPRTLSDTWAPESNSDPAICSPADNSDCSSSEYTSQSPSPTLSYQRASNGPFQKPTISGVDDLNDWHIINGAHSPMLRTTQLDYIPHISQSSELFEPFLPSQAFDHSNAASVLSSMVRASQKPFYQSDWDVENHPHTPYNESDHIYPTVSAKFWELQASSSDPPLFLVR